VLFLAAYDTISAAGQTVSDIIAASILPTAVELMDRLSIEAAEASVHPNYPACEALLLVELDGPAIEVDLQVKKIREICRANVRGRIAWRRVRMSASWYGREGRQHSRRRAGWLRIT
jgi:glycolate oxidase